MLLRRFVVLVLAASSVAGLRAEAAEEPKAPADRVAAVQQQQKEAEAAYRKMEGGMSSVFLAGNDDQRCP